MDALYLKDLADKTRRGLRGRVQTASRAAPTPQPASVSTSVSTLS